MELDALPQPEHGAARIFGKLELIGQREMVVELRLVVLDQRVVHDVEEIVRRRGPLVLQRVEPARRDVSVPGKGHRPRGGDAPCGEGAPRKGVTKAPLAAIAAALSKVRRVSCPIYVLPTTGIGSALLDFERL